MKRRLAPSALRDRDGHPHDERENRASRNDLRPAAERLPANGRHATARMLRLLVLPALLATAGHRTADAAKRYGHLESLSMRAEQLRQVSENVEFGQGPEKLGADEPFVRFLEADAYVDFELACDPEKQTYLTVRVWGSSGSGGYGPGSVLLLRDPEKGDKPFGHVPFGPNARKHPMQGEIVRQYEAKAFPGRFYYATYPLPRELTRGKSTVPLRLLYKGPKPGVDVYRAYTHLDAFFQPAADEVQGQPFELGPPRDGEGATPQERFEHWKAEANRGIRRVLREQIFGPEWEQRIQNGETPEWVLGAIGGGKPHRHYREHCDNEIDMIGGHLMRQTHGNFGAMRFLLTYAMAYRGEWSDFHQDQEMLDRIVAAMDFYCKAQGECGGFLGPSLPRKDVNWPTWLGGPNRKKGHHGLEAGQYYLYKAFHLVLDDLQSRGMLEKAIDHDLNPDTPKIARKDAYAAMLKRSYEKTSNNVLNRSIANQIIHNYLPAYTINKALLDLCPEKAVPDAELERLAEIAAGVRRHPNWGHYSYSPKGMPLEDGYDGNYGGCGMQLVDLARETRYPALEKKAGKVFEAYAHFMYLSNDAEGYGVLRNTDWISTRVLKGFPGVVRYPRSHYAAQELKIPAAIRYFELYEMHGCDRMGELPPMESLSGHRSVHTLGAARKAEEAMAALGEMPSTDYRLPDEREEDNAFVDEFLGLVTLRHGDARMFAMLNWESRSGKDWMTGKANNLVRLRYTTPTIDRLVTATCMDNEGGPMGLNTMRYGPYLVVLNGSETESFRYEVPEDMQGREAKELLSGKRGTLGNGAVLPPFSSRVFAVDESTR